MVKVGGEFDSRSTPTPMKKFALVAAVAVLASLSTSRADIVINEVYAGGNNTNAPFNQDFVELFNNGSTQVDIGGWTVQYQPATSTVFSLIATIPANTFLLAGDFYTITAAPVPAGTTGANVPNDQAGNSVNLATAGGKVFLFNNAATPLTVDLVGWGNANQAEGTAAPAMTNTTSLQRIANGFDSDNNSSDFRLLSPTPDAFNVIPEPSTYAMIGLGGLLLVGMQRFRRKS